MNCTTCEHTHGLGCKECPNSENKEKCIVIYEPIPTRINIASGEDVMENVFNHPMIEANEV